MKIHDFAVRFLFENRRFWTKIRDFAAVTGYAPRAARGAQWRVLSGSKTRRIIHIFGLIVDEHLTSAPQTQNLANRARQRLGFLRRVSKFLRPQCTRISYGHVLSPAPSLGWARRKQISKGSTEYSRRLHFSSEAGTSARLFRSTLYYGRLTRLFQRWPQMPMAAKALSPKTRIRVCAWL